MANETILDPAMFGSKVTDASDRARILRAYLDAGNVQNACNLSGIAASFADAVRALWIEANAFGKGTDYVNRHPVATLWLSKMMDLNGEMTDFERFSRAETTRCLAASLSDSAIGSEAHKLILDDYFRAV